MYTSQPPTSSIRRSPAISATGETTINVPGKNRVWVHGFRSNLRSQSRRVRGSTIRAVVSKEESKSSTVTIEDTTAIDGVGGMMDLKATITIKKQMKEKVIEKIEDQWESFVIGIGRGVLIQLISEEIDPGNHFFQLLLQFYLQSKSKVDNKLIIWKGYITCIP